MARTQHDPRCRILHEPPSLRDPNDCNCGAFPPLAREARPTDVAGQIREAREALERSRNRARTREPTDNADAQIESLGREVLELRSAVDRLVYALELATRNPRHGVLECACGRKHAV